MSKQTIQDEICYCAHCGISFVWAQEEQAAAQQAAAQQAAAQQAAAQQAAAQQAAAQPGGNRPTLCPGCRHLTPAAGRERGLVKWYDRRRQYGFIVRQGQPDIYFHRSGLGAGQVPQPGDLVEFAVEMSERGPAASEVAILRPSVAAVKP